MPPTPDPQPSIFPPLWEQIEKKLFPLLATIDALPDRQFHASTLDEWRGLWGSHKDETEQAIVQWIQTDELPTDQLVRFLVLARICAAYHLVKQLSLPALPGYDPAIPLFPSLPISLEETLWFLLSHWWNHIGEGGAWQQLASAPLAPGAQNN